MPSYAGDSTTWDQVKDMPSETWSKIKEGIGKVHIWFMDFFRR